MVDFPKMDEVHPQAVTIAPPMDMTHQHGHMQAAPQQRSLIRTIGTFTGGGVFFLVLLVLAEAVLIDDLKPSKLWGGFMGKTQAEQIKASEAATVGLEQQLAHVRAEEQQKAQAQLAQLQNQLDTTKEAYGSLYRRSEALVTGYMSMQQTFAANGGIATRSAAKHGRKSRRREIFAARLPSVSPEAAKAAAKIAGDSPANEEG